MVVVVTRELVQHWEWQKKKVKYFREGVHKKYKELINQSLTRITMLGVTRLYLELSPENIGVLGKLVK